MAWIEVLCVVVGILHIHVILQDQSSDSTTCFVDCLLSAAKCIIYVKIGFKSIIYYPFNAAGARDARVECYRDAECDATTIDEGDCERGNETRERETSDETSHWI